MQHRISSRLIGASIGVLLAAATIGGARAASPDAPSTGSHASTLQVLADATGPAASHDSAGSDPAPSRNAARSRMRECGHQWSSMKKSGAANGMTWKEFSQGCLAKQ